MSGIQALYGAPQFRPATTEEQLEDLREKLECLEEDESRRPTPFNKNIIEKIKRRIETLELELEDE